MTNWPEIPVVATLQAILEEKEKRTEIDAKSLKESLGEHLKRGDKSGGSRGVYQRI